MSAIRCHFDGKVFVPDEPVDLPVGKPLLINVRSAWEVRHGVTIVHPPSGRPSTVGDLLKSEAVGGRAHRTDIMDNVEYAREVRRRAEIRGGRRDL